MKVKDLMITNVVAAKPDDTLDQVAQILWDRHFTGIPVVDDNNTLLGLIAERDFITSDSHLYLPTYIKLLREIDFVKSDKKIISKPMERIINARAVDVMNRNVITTDSEMDIVELAKIFGEKHVNPIPVVDANKKMVGIISRSDLIKLFSEKKIAETFSAQEEQRNTNRLIDQRVGNVHGSLRSGFTYVSKLRVALWFSLAILFFAIGVIIGVSIIADPGSFRYLPSLP